MKLWILLSMWDSTVHVCCVLCWQECDDVSVPGADCVTELCIVLTGEWWCVGAWSWLCYWVVYCADRSVMMCRCLELIVLLSCVLCWQECDDVSVPGADCVTELCWLHSRWCHWTAVHTTIRATYHQGSYLTLLHSCHSSTWFVSTQITHFCNCIMPNFIFWNISKINCF